MKKIRIFIAILVTILIACCFISAKPKSFLNSASAETTSTTSNVTFYGEDRTTPLLNIPNWSNGSTLYQFKNSNIIQDSLLSDIVFTGGILNTWSTDNDSYYTYVDNTLVIDKPTSYTRFIVYNLNTSLYRGSTLCFGMSLNGVEYYYNFNIKSSGVAGTGGNYFIEDLGVQLRVYIYNDNRMGLTLDYFSTSIYPITIDYAFCYFNEKQDFYSYDYLKRLYLNNIQISFDNLNDYDLLFTDNYYSYSQYFGSSYIVSKSTDFYLTYYDRNIETLPPQDYTFDNGNNIFENTGTNLLNYINQSAVSFSLQNLIANDYELNITSTFTLNKILPIYQNASQIYTIYTAENGNKFYFYSFYITINNNYKYFNILYDYEIVNTNFISIPYFDYDSHIFFVNGEYKIFGDAEILDLSVSSNYTYEYKINYNMQFYYADYFGVKFWLDNYTLNNGGSVSVYFKDRQNRYYSISKNTRTYDEWLLSSAYLKNSLVDSFIIKTYNLSTLNIENNTFSTKNDALNYLLNQTLTIYTTNEKLYFFNNETNTNSSAIIPTTSDGLYKEKEHWYDFTIDLYNFVIYICFDAPFISNITQLLYVIISLIKKLFDLIIALFITSNSTIFIAIFFGFFLLKMILNKVIGGK